MKKLKFALTVLMCSILLTGCVRLNTTINVKRNGKLDVSMLYAAVDMSDYGFSGEGISSDMQQKFIDEGWNVEDYSQDGFTGFLISKDNLSAKELADTMKDTENSLEGGGSINFTKQGLKYILDWKVFDREIGEQISTYRKYFALTGGYMKLTVTLPVKPSASNATSVSEDGKTLEWDLLDLDSDQKVHLEFSLINVWMIIGIIAAVWLIIAIIVMAVVVSSSKKKNRSRIQ